ncbi:MAG: rRNA maturation RNase YbeY, partial [Rickettsiales bacterium]
DDGEGVLEAILGEEGHEEERYYLGDVILGAQTVEREAKEQGKLFTEHFAHLLVHGCLHVLGYDHMNDAEAEIMEGLEIAILKELSIANPYEKAYN